ncbi:MAG TPA: hypothetical protein VFL59_09290 [Candidatus Nanopelagicales bacterium]|nr:hypothetical protein [Candidatus Nanopelagicales bacterium]
MSVTQGAPASLLPGGVPAQRSPHELPSSWLATHSRKVRLRRYARAMGWDVTTDGALVGEVGGLAVRAYEDRTHATVLEMAAPGLLPLMEMVGSESRVAQVGDGMREVHLGDPVFEKHYVVRAAEPWMARAVIDHVVRRALMSAPEQSWITVGERLVSRSRARIEPLDLFARATALRVLVHAIPWEAYGDAHTLPTHEAVTAALAERRAIPTETLPSMPRHA